MLKRTKGRLLITLLVVTGLAGTLNSSSISQKERKQAVLLLKNTRNDLVKSLEDLSEKQLNFQPGPNQPSISELVVSLAGLEKRETAAISELMALPSNSESRLKIAFGDEELLEGKCERIEIGTPVPNTQRQKTGEALKEFLEIRNANIRYIRTSTEDLRNHVTESSIGWIDCYQKFLLLAEQTKRSIAAIEAVKSSKGFPK